MTLFLFINIAYIAAVPREEIRRSGQLIAVLFFQNVFGSTGTKLFPLLVAASCFGNIVGAFSLCSPLPQSELTRLSLRSLWWTFYVQCFRCISSDPFADNRTGSHNTWSRETRFIALSRILHVYQALWHPNWTSGSQGSPHHICDRRRTRQRCLQFCLGPCIVSTSRMIALVSEYWYSFTNPFLKIFQSAMSVGIWVLRRRRSASKIPPSAFQARNGVVVIYLTSCVLLLVLPWYVFSLTSWARSELTRCLNFANPLY